MDQPKSTFRTCFPLLSTAVVNKIGDLGFRYLPMLLVDLRLDAGESSIILSGVKIAMAVAIIVGGHWGDRLGYRTVILMSFVVSAFGMLGLSVSSTVVLVAASAWLAGFGQGLYRPTMRLLLVETIPEGARREALAWLRSAVNGGVMISSLLALLAAKVGLSLFFLFDAVTSLVAVVYGSRTLPKGSKVVLVRSSQSISRIFSHNLSNHC